MRKTLIRRAGGLVIALVLAFALCIPVAGAQGSGTLTWDGKPATLEDIAASLGYDMVDVFGGYKPMYSSNAKSLWEKGLFLGANGSFNLDKPLTRTEGVIMTLRVLGKEQEAIAMNLPCPFTDVPGWACAQVAYAAKMGITSGYSATSFGGSDTMTANQYITFILRSMGYDDSAGDFVWSSAAEKAFELGIIGVSCKDQYMRSNLFLRDNVAHITDSALVNAKCKDGSRLIDTILLPGKPEGKMPYDMTYNSGFIRYVTTDLYRIAQNLNVIYMQGESPGTKLSFDESTRYCTYRANGTLEMYVDLTYHTYIEFGNLCITSNNVVWPLIFPSMLERHYTELMDGTYLFAADLCEIYILYLDSATFKGYSLQEFQTVTNNPAVTQQILSSMQAETTSGLNNNVAIIYRPAGDNDGKIGVYALLNTSGYHTGEADLARPMFDFNEGSEYFGQRCMARLTDYDN